MRFLRSKRSFALRHHEKGQKNETLLEGSFCLPMGKDNRLIGEYPRRVGVGDVLAFCRNRKILSPANGIADSRIQVGETSLFITQDGSLEPKHSYREPSRELTSLLSNIDENSIYSLDFPGAQDIPLSEYLADFSQNSGATLVLSPFSRIGSPDFQKILLRDYSTEIHHLVGLFTELFPKQKIRSYLEDSNLRYSYPMGIPDYFCHRIAGYSILGEKARDRGRVYYLGGETIWHLVRSLYFGIPFTRRHLSVFCVDRHGRLDGKERSFLLSNGQSFDFLTGIFAKEYNTYSLDHFFFKGEILDRTSRHYFNIFETSSIVFYAAKPKEFSELPCTECWECSYHCPTQANPIGLVLAEERFSASHCVHCGLCSIHCPSGIDLRKRMAPHFTDFVSMSGGILARGVK